MARRTDPHARLRDYQHQYEQLVQRLTSIGFIMQGSIQRRMLTCGKPSCACHTDPEARHGPYIYWSTTKGSKTVSKLLSPDKAELYEQWITNRKQLDGIVQQMKRLSQRALVVALRAAETGEEPDSTAPTGDERAS